MDEQTKEKLKEVYRVYIAIAWITIGALMLLVSATLLGARLEGENATITLLYYARNLPIILTAPLFIGYSVFTIFSVVLNIKVWPIKEIRCTLSYWWDWFEAISIVIFGFWLLIRLLSF